MSRRGGYAEFMWLVYALVGIVVTWLVVKLIRAAAAKEVADRPMTPREREMNDIEHEEWPGGPSERARRRGRRPATRAKDNEP